MNSRLNISMRERAGLVYSVDSYLNTYPDTGFWNVYFGCDTHDTSRCSRLLRRELDKLMNKPLCPATLNAAKKQLCMTEEIEEKKVEKTAEGVVLKEDPKYLAGAIQLNAEGKVEFVLDTQASGKSADEIYNIVFQYMSKLIKNEQNINSRIALVNRNNKNEQIIACIMDEWFVFNQSFISLDRSETKYQLVATISDNHLHLSMTRIVFNYEEGRSTGFKEPAENVITDKYALTKKKNDLAKIYGKFRRGTIDRKDQIFNDLTKLVRK